MSPFLLQVARHYTGASGLEDYCFVFPNRRSGQFFADYLQKELAAHDRETGACRPHLMPSVTSIDGLVTRLTDTVCATDIEMIFALYEAYCQAMGSQAQEFDKFIYWAQLILGDFNDIDKSLADAHAIYSNLDDLHSLSSNYLTADVKEKVERIFGESLFTAFFDTSNEASLWQQRHDKKLKDKDKTPTDPEKDVVKQEFVSLWNALGRIYDLFHQVLDGKGLVSPGRQLRLAAENPSTRLPYSRFVFVGFGVLSAAEVKLFDFFKQEDNADFWWDNAGIPDLLEKAPHDPGALLIDSYCTRFGAKTLEPLNGHKPQLRVMAVPSNVGQAKQAMDEVIRMKAQGDKSLLGIESAIVLPDENLLVPLLHSVHGVERLNVTLGYPLRASGIVSLMHIVARMHYLSTKGRDGGWTYYREDVNDILSHPLIKTYFTNEAFEMSVELSRTNRFRVPAGELSHLSFHDLFTPAMDSGQARGLQDQQADYLDHLISFCELLMKKMPSAADKEDDGNDGVVLPLQQAFLVMYINILNQLKGSLAQCGNPLLRTTVFYMIDRLASSAIVPFTGEPLQGLQIMGLLETRSLDFENVVILSMNERVFPRRHGINSFIPNYMRRAHGMSTIEQQEAIVAFNFYRLLNRARHVTLIYDSSTQDGSSNEPSRYITQLEKIYGVNLDLLEMNAAVQTSSPISIVVPNPGRDTLEAMYLQRHEWADKWYLSASAINQFISCPLSFYLHYAQGLSNDNALSDFMDSGTFGTIIHDVLKTCYNVKPEEKNGHTVTAEEINYFKEKRLEPTVVYYIKKHYLKIPKESLETDTSHLTGEAFMLVDTIKSYVTFVLDHDLKIIGTDNKNAFTVLECEKPHHVENLEIGGARLNFTYTPDRIDRLADGTVRIVDYKTGGDPTSFSDLNALFDASKDHKGGDKQRCKAILQLFLYCYAYLTENEKVDKVQPVIYKLTSMQSSGVKYSKRQFEFSMDNELVKQFIGEMGAVINSIYSEGFRQADEDSLHCNYCRFIDFCRRSIKERDF